MGDRRRLGGDTQRKAREGCQGPLHALHPAVPEHPSQDPCENQFWKIGLGAPFSETRGRVHAVKEVGGTCFNPDPQFLTGKLGVTC